MELGIGRFTVMLACALSLACGRSAVPRAASAQQATPALSSSGAPASGTPAPASVTPASGSIETRVEGERVWVNGASVGVENLASAMNQARGNAELFGVKLAAGFASAALLSVLDAGNRAGFKQARIEHGSETLMVELSGGEARVGIIAWVNDEGLVAYDLESSPEQSGLFGPFDVTDEVSLGRLRSALTKACGGRPCSAELDLLHGRDSGAVWLTLSAWHRALSGIPGLSSRVRAVVPTPSTPPSSNAQPSSTSAPKVRYGATTVSGRLPPVVIQHIVRKNYGKFRVCYEAGLGRNADLTGRVSARFVIGRDGKVSKVADGGSDIADSEVVNCVLRAVHTLEFPPPANGIVTVVYPIFFAPG